MEQETIPTGALVEKINSTADDKHADGALARVKSMLGPADDGGYGYFVEWSDMPGVSSFVAGTRIRAVAAASAAR